MITVFNSQPGWGAQPPPLIRPAQLTIPHDFPPMVWPDPGVKPDWWPINPMQQAGLCSPAQMLLFGGQSGGGKSDFLVGDAMQEYRISSFRGLLLRESLGEMDQIGDRMERAYLPLGGRYRQRSGGGEWRFPSGAKIRFGYMQYDKDLGRYRGNPRSWIGIDESGLQPEKRVRTMLPWLSSVDKRLRPRMRLASNPGGVGHGWQMSVFLRNKCPLHFPADKLDSRPHETSVWPGRVYSGASWKWPPSYAELIHMTTAFFPASVSDNPAYLDDEKIKRLLSQTQEIQMQLLYGCWCNAASLYFGFMRPEWMIPYQSIQDEWWWHHFISIDFGYGNSYAAAGRFSVDDNGRVFGTGELVEQKMSSVDFAKKICEQWVKKRTGEERPRMLFVTIDPANDDHDGTGKSNFELMEEVFAQYGIPCIKSHKGSQSNAQNLYNGLANQYLVITDAMRQTFSSIATRVIDDRRAVKKVHGDSADDLYDMIAYAYNTWILESVKPDYLKLQDTLEKMRQNGADATAIARRSLVETSKLKKKEMEQGAGLPMRAGAGRKRR